MPWAKLRESSAWHAPAARDAERPSAGKGGRKGASASKDRRSERFGFTGATKELPTEAAGNGRAWTAPSIAQELSLITGISASLAIADGSLSLMQCGGLCLPSWLTISRGPQDRGGESAYLEQAISLSEAGLMRAWGPPRVADASQMMQAERCILRLARTSPRCSAWRAEDWSLEGRGISAADVSRGRGHGLPWAAQSESSAWHAPARDAERPSAGKAM